MWSYLIQRTELSQFVQMYIYSLKYVQICIFIDLRLVEYAYYNMNMLIIIIE